MTSRESILSHVREQRTEAQREHIRSLDPHGYWNDNQALALLDSLKLESGRPKWKQEYIDQLHDWASAHEKGSPNSVEAQLAFVGYQLLNTHSGIGRELSKAQTYDNAKEALEPFVNLISEPVRWLTLEEAKDMDYQDEGNPKLKQ
jgi:hypothetical protein